MLLRPQKEPDEGNLAQPHLIAVVIVVIEILLLVVVVVVEVVVVGSR